MDAVPAVDRLRRGLDRELFPDAPPPPRITARRALVCAGLAVLCVVVQLVRMWSTVPLDSIWAEDGATWLPDAMSHGVVDALTKTYNGYLQTSSRLVAEPVALLGASPGQTIEYQLPTGMHRLRIEKIIYQPEDSLRTYLVVRK